MQRHPNYAELHCLSNFSFLRGASHPEDMVERAHALGYRALAITDECSLAGVVRAHLRARELGLQLIVGTEIRLADGPRLVLLAADREGYGDLSELITKGRRRAPKCGYELRRADLERGLAGCLGLLLADGSGIRGTGFRDRDSGFREQDSGVGDWEWFARTFRGRGWIAVELHRTGSDAGQLAALEALGRATGLPLAAAGDVHMHVRSRRALQDTLTAIRLKTTLAEAGLALFPNGERHLRPREALAQLYPPVLLAETLRIAGRCRFTLEELRYEYPEELVPPGETPASHLRALTETGLRARWPVGAPEEVHAQVEHELGLIAELGYEPFFLTVHDIVRFARSRGILCQGRGSAANSIVCYCLGITEVHPARVGLLFERFVSKERNEPPDIDVDFEHERREEVIQYVYRKYGRERAALAATVISYRAKSAVRDVGKALGMGQEQVDRIAKAIHWWDGRQVDPGRLREAGVDPDSPAVKRLMALAGALIGFPRHLSQHVGGMVIARGRLSRLVPIENAVMAERTVIQWDKDDLEALGLLKVDCLALGMLSAIRRAFDLIEGCRGERLSMAGLPAGDPEVYAMIQRADTIGVFQIESRAQMSMLPRLRPACYYDLVIEVAIVRPGPIQGDMVHPYLRRREGSELVSYPSEAVKGVLERTLGVPIFQEQVIKLAIVAAGFSPGEADRLRRSMASWRHNGDVRRFEQPLIDGMRERGYTEKFARQIFRQIEGFGEYGFPESHAASFALLVYVSAWLKHHEPAAFCAALLNSQPMGFYAPAQLVQDARRHGVEVRPVDVCTSGWECGLERDSGVGIRGSGFRGRDSAGRIQDSGSGIQGAGGRPQPAVRLGLCLVKGLSRAGAGRLVEVRAQAPFENVQDMARRAGLNRRDLQALAAGGALKRLAGNRHQARWQVLGIEEPLALESAAAEAPVAAARRTVGAAGMQNGRAYPAVHGVRREDNRRRPAEPLPMLRPPREGEDLVEDYASVGLSLGRHPLALLRRHLERLGLCTAARVHELPHGHKVHTGGLVITRQRPGTATGVVFVTLEDETGYLNLVVWSSLVERQRRELLGARLMGVVGEVQREGEVVHVIAARLEDHSGLLGRLSTESRDFR